MFITFSTAGHPPEVTMQGHIKLTKTGQEDPGPDPDLFPYISMKRADHEPWTRTRSTTPRPPSGSLRQSLKAASKVRKAEWIDDFTVYINMKFVENIL